MKIADATERGGFKKRWAKPEQRSGGAKVRVLMTEEGLTAIQAKAFKPKTTDSKGTTAAPNLLANIRVEECAAHKIIIGDITDIRRARRPVLLFGSLAG